MFTSSEIILAIKIDVDTERGTRLGIPNLLRLLQKLKIPATFFLALGPDNTGRAIKRIFHRGFLSKVQRTSVIKTYGIRTLLNGVLLKGPHVGKLHANLLKEIQNAGFDIGIHCYDHVLWQDGVEKMSQAEIAREFNKARVEFERIFAVKAKSAAAPGWQANAKTFAVYDDANLIYGSDCRGKEPFFPSVDNQTFHTLQIPTTLPTLDELLGRSDFPLEKLSDYYASLLKPNQLNVLTIHAELEGMCYLDWFEKLLITLKTLNVTFCDLNNIAEDALKTREKIPYLNVMQNEIPGRSGRLAIV